MNFFAQLVLVVSLAANAIGLVSANPASGPIDAPVHSMEPQKTVANGADIAPSNTALLVQGEARRCKGCPRSKFFEVSTSLDADLSVRYYSKVLTNEGVLRESRYEENMLRRAAHVWVERVLPKEVITVEHTHSGHSHKNMNYALMSRHVMLEDGKVRLAYVDHAHRQVIAISPVEYDDVNFDGSWTNAFFLLDPKQVANLPLSPRRSAVPGARWHEQERKEVFQRVLWDQRRQIPLIIENGDKAGRFFNRIEVVIEKPRSSALPWANLQGYAQREYADFLD